MSKDGIDLNEELYEYRNPVTHQVTLHFRKRHNHIRSPRLKAYDACIAEAMTGVRARGGTPAEDMEAIRQDLRASARRCAQHDKITS